MQGSGGNNPGGGGPQRPFGRYAELNQAHARVAKERTDRSVAQLEKADRTHPAESRGSAPAVATGNRWIERGWAMVDQLHGRMFGRYAPGPDGTEVHSIVRSAARGHQVGEQPAVPARTPASVATTPGRIGIETISLQEQARHTTVATHLPGTKETLPRTPDRQPNAGIPTPVGPTSAGVDFIYDRLNRVAALKGVAVGELATKAAATAFKGAEREVGNRHTLSPDHDTVDGRPVTPAVRPPAKVSMAKHLADPAKSTGDAMGIEPGD